VLKRHFDGLSVANNHSGDFGKEAFVEQCELMEKAKIPYFGGGRNLVDAHKPWIVEHNGVRIGLLGYCEVYLQSFEAKEDVSGVAWSAHDHEVLADLRAAREKHKCDDVIPYMHWGPEHEPADERQKLFARKMIDAGADIIVGGHPHVTQEAETYHGRPIIYSLGNFVFNGFEDEENLIGWALRMVVDKKGVVAWDTVTAHLDGDGVPHPDFKAKSPSGRRGSDKIQMRLPGKELSKPNR
jgi:poly-gamma-glutamate synthesis protein (capsule biosynthesis protein)